MSRFCSINSCDCGACSSFSDLEELDLEADDVEDLSCHWCGHPLCDGDCEAYLLALQEDAADAAYDSIDDETEMGA